MALEDSLVTGAAVAAVTGNFDTLGRDLDYMVRQVRIDAATGTGSADVHVQLEHLVTFYNALSNLHSQLLDQIAMVESSATNLASINAGGKVPGTQKAWTAMAHTAGLSNSSTSLTANLKSVDALVLQHMAALHHNAQQYAQQENLAIRSLGQAAGTGGTEAVPGAEQLPEPKVSDKTGLGGK